MDAHGLRIATRALSVRLADGRALLDGVDLDVPPGTVLAIAGPSGAGKTTLLEELAAGHPAGTIGFVPQDDLVHLDLALARTLMYAAQLRLPAKTSGAEAAEAVARVLGALGLEDLAGQRVGSLSGGERKRASIAVELLTRPQALFLDEPTSGLDPAAGARLLVLLRDLARAGTTVVLSTHNPADLVHADAIAFLANGRLLFRGPPEELAAAFDVKSVEEVYGIDPAEVPPLPALAPVATASPALAPSAPSPGAVRQWWLLTRRSAAILTRNRLSAAVVVGSPVMIAAMFAMLFRPHAFATNADNPGSSAMIMFWIAFGAFFFGLTYGLLQICTELPIVRRECRTVLRLGPYLASKVTLLLPVDRKSVV